MPKQTTQRSGRASPGRVSGCGSNPGHLVCLLSRGGALGRESLGPALCPPPPGPLCSVCVNRFGCRPVMLAGGLLASLGMVAASFCRSIVQLYLTTGVITGEWGPAGSRAGHGALSPQRPDRGQSGGPLGKGRLWVASHPRRQSVPRPRVGLSQHAGW